MRTLKGNRKTETVRKRRIGKEEEEREKKEEKCRWKGETMRQERNIMEENMEEKYNKKN
jgi:hypothetical protein